VCEGREEGVEGEERERENLDDIMYEL